MNPMIIYQCDLCGELRDCVPRQIEGTEYDICSNCWNELTAKLKDKGRPKSARHTVQNLPSVVLPEPSPETRKPFPGQPPEIIGESMRTN